jgi:hypothetical protein
VRLGRLTRFGHVNMQMTGCQPAEIWQFHRKEVEVEKHGRSACVADDMRRLGLRQEDAQDRTVGRIGILGDHPTSASAAMWMLKR